MKIGIMAGHNVFINDNFDTGAIGNNTTESEFVKETVRELLFLLKEKGHEVKDLTPYNLKVKQKYEHHKIRSQRINDFEPFIVLDIHLNAFNGKASGSEILLNLNNQVSKKYSKKILSNLKELGLTIRGLKDGSKFYTIKGNRYPSLIIEGAFIDNKEDMNKIDPFKYALAIANSFEAAAGKTEKIQKNIINLEYNNINISVKGLQTRDTLNNPTNFIPVSSLRDLGFKVSGKGNNIKIYNKY